MHSQQHLMPPRWDGKPAEEFVANNTADETIGYEVFAANTGGPHPHLLPTSHTYFDRFRRPYPTR